jgi:hypothetical protein
MPESPEKNKTPEGETPRYCGAGLLAEVCVSAETVEKPFNIE